MPKTITKYRGYTATQLKTRANLPKQADMVVSGNNVLCSNVQVSDVKYVVNSPYTDVWNLCREDKVNVWSGFGPTKRGVSGSGYHSSLINIKTTGATLGDFAGYNHTATTPGWGNGKAAAQTDVWINSGTKATVISDIVLGELQYENADGVVLVAFNSASGVTAYGEEPTSSLTEYANLSAESVDNITINTTWTLRSYLKVGTILSSLDVASVIMYRVPNVDDAIVNIKIKQATTYPTTVPSPWTITGSVGFNLTTGYYSLNGIESATAYSQIRIYATLFDWTNSVIGSANLFNGAYSAFTSINNSVYLGLAPVSNFGYRVELYFEEDF